MQDLTSPGGDLEPIERASADQLHALQLERLRWSLRTPTTACRAASSTIGRADRG